MACIHKMALKPLFVMLKRNCLGFIILNIKKYQIITTKIINGTILKKYLINTLIYTKILIQLLCTTKNCLKGILRNINGKFIYI